MPGGRSRGITTLGCILFVFFLLQFYSASELSAVAGSAFSVSQPRQHALRSRLGWLLSSAERLLSGCSGWMPCSVSSEFDRSKCPFEAQIKKHRAEGRRVIMVDPASGIYAPAGGITKKFGCAIVTSRNCLQLADAAMFNTMMQHHPGYWAAVRNAAPWGQLWMAWSSEAPVSSVRDMTDPDALQHFNLTSFPGLDADYPSTFGQGCSLNGGEAA